MRSNSNMPPRASCLIVDDEPTSSLILSSILSKLGMRVDAVAEPQQMFSLLKGNTYDAIFLDYRLGETNGLDLLPDILGSAPQSRIVMITAHGSIELALEALRCGVSGFITKPFDAEDVANELQRSFRLTNKRSLADSQLASGETGIVGSSLAVQRMHDQILRMKDVSSTVLIRGESGTGKELIARALHNLSKRSKKPFSAVNCAAIPATLLEAELFGYRKGAFTDARQDRKGLFESCGSGTLFLDEIGEMPLSLQSKLLRVVQEKVVTPLGSTDAIKVDTRIVAATNRPLMSLVKQGEFREDLYYRLSVLQIEAPPLRERIQDLPDLIQYFISRMRSDFGEMVFTIDSATLSKLSHYDWPGNIRELQNAVERAMVLSSDGRMHVEHMLPGLSNDTLTQLGMGASITSLSLKEAKQAFEKSYLEQLLRETGGNVAEASRIAGRVRTDMYRLFTKYGLDPNQFK